MISPRDSRFRWTEIRRDKKKKKNDKLKSAKGWICIYKGITIRYESKVRSSHGPFSQNVSRNKSDFELIVPARIIIRRSVGQRLYIIRKYFDVFVIITRSRDLSVRFLILDSPTCPIRSRHSRPPTNLLSHLSRRNHSHSLVILRPVPHTTITPRAT